MTCWEYMISEEKLDSDQINQLGAEGWEMVAVASPGHFVLHYFLKRLVVSQPIITQ